MQIFKKKTNIDFIGKRKFFGGLSLAAVIVSLILIIFEQPKFGIDFVGGTEIQIDFKDTEATVSKIRAELTKLGYDGADVVSFGEGSSEYLIHLKIVSAVDDDSQKETIKTSIKKALGDNEVARFELSPGGDKLSLYLTKEVSVSDVERAVGKSGLEVGKVSSFDDNADSGEDSNRRCESATCTWSYKDEFVYEVNLVGISDQVMTALRAQPWGAKAEKMRSVWVGAKVGSQLRNAGISSIAYALLFIMVYIAFRFDLRFAPGAVVALIHDITITLGIFTLFRIEVTLETVAAFLTIVGYSLNDTIVIFDRIRENMSITREIKLVTVINRSLNETLSRTILTSVTTFLSVTALYVIGWYTSLRDFSFALLVGVIVGTYSSIYVASPVVILLDRYFSEKKKA
ncbi:MAG: protein translocase subunit SecF [Deltaproteobacteria bacterium]|nr:protein translocase subunit SecF [Deltaproteobacteria bacterium]